jgi:hypothetical protein
VSDGLAELLAKRRQRCMAIVLTVKEDEVDTYLPPEVSRKLRKVVLDQFNDLYTFAVDLIGSDPVVNDAYLAKFEQISRDVQVVRRLLEPVDK